MSEICRFLGIVIAMCYRDHEPAHFHAIYGDHEVTVAIAGGVVTGTFPRRALRHVEKWRELHRDELLQLWAAARQRQPLGRVDPLE